MGFGLWPQLSAKHGLHAGERCDMVFPIRVSGLGFGGLGFRVSIQGSRKVSKGLEDNPLPRIRLRTGRKVVQI